MQYYHLNHNYISDCDNIEQYSNYKWFIDIIYNHNQTLLVTIKNFNLAVRDSISRQLIWYLIIMIVKV